MKRLLVIAAAAAGVAAWKKMQDQQAERELWAEATDEVPTVPAVPSDN
jgi:hypothetical protein